MDLKNSLVWIRSEIEVLSGTRNMVVNVTDDPQVDIRMSFGNFNIALTMIKMLVGRQDQKVFSLLEGSKAQQLATDINRSHLRHINVEALIRLVWLE